MRLKPADQIEIIFAGGLDEREKDEMEAKGYRGCVKAVVNGKVYPIVFYDPVRLDLSLRRGSMPRYDCR